MLLAGYFWPMHSRAETNWTPLRESTGDAHSQKPSGSKRRWDAVPKSENTTSKLVWEPLSPEQADTAPEDLIWATQQPSHIIVNEQQDSISTEELKLPEMPALAKWPVNERRSNLL